MGYEFDLEDRLIEFSVNIIDLSDRVKKTFAGIHLLKQVIRSGTSPALNYGEAISAESRKDFIHKMRVCLKELQETNINLKILIKSKLIGGTEKTDSVVNECIELIKIFSKSIKTAKINKTQGRI